MIYRFRLRTQFSEGTGKLEVHTDEKRVIPSEMYSLGAKVPSTSSLLGRLKIPEL